MSTKEDILSRLRQNTRETYDLPDFGSIKPITYADPVEEFKTKTTTTAGAKLIELDDEANLNEVIREAYPDAKIIASNLPGVEADLNPDAVGSAQELMKVDVGVVEGRIGVAENACIWIPQQMKEKAVCFISENLVILLPKSQIVNNMHEAYARLSKGGDDTAQFDDYGYGTFISGPSKTADIAQVFVMGAQAARSVTVLLLPE